MIMVYNRDLHIILFFSFVSRKLLSKQILKSIIWRNYKHKYFSTNRGFFSRYFIRLEILITGRHNFSSSKINNAIISLSYPGILDINGGAQGRQQSRSTTV